MAELVIVSRTGRPIRSVEEWAIEAKPAMAVHWQDGRSAKELARAWIEGSGRAALTALLDLDRLTAGFSIESAVAEAQTAFDRWRGGKRNHDLLLVGQARGGTTIVGLESKADETFGQTLTSYAAGAQRRIVRGEPTNAHLRLAELTTALAGATVSEAHELGQLRYQLFSAVAGTLAAAEGLQGAQAVFIIHEFITEKTDVRRQAANNAALSAFTERLFATSPPVDESSWLLGPFHVPATRWERLPLWIGKISTETAADGGRSSDR